jgi:SPP1 gp7 family putative phage head morphogenesis protein
MKNEEYWKKRQSEKLDNAIKNAVADIEEVKRFYHKAYLYTDKQIEGIFDSYRSHHRTDSAPMSEKEARELLNNLVNDHDYAELKRKLENNPSSSAKKELLKKLDAPAYQARINRLMELQSKLDSLMRLEYNLEKEKSTDAYLKGIYDGYYRNVFNISKGMGIAYDFAEIDPTLVDHMLKSAWYDKNYSKRIWGNAQNLGNELKDQLMLGAIMGKTHKEMSQTLQDKFASGAANCERLVRTEMAAFINSIDLVNFKDAGIEKEMFIAVHDGRTSKICQQHDRSIINVKDAQIGVNVPPLHPNCRSHMIPYIEGITDNMKKRQRDPITGKDEVVDVKENYDQWLKRQQDKHGVDTVDVYMKKTKNLTKDRKQFSRYRNVLGNQYIPDTLKEFQEIKYTDEKQWNDLEYNYRTVNRYKTDYGEIDIKTILELDKEAFTAKDKYMTTRAANGNVASMKIGDDIFVASSRISDDNSDTFKNYKGDKSKLILSPSEKRLHPHTKDHPYEGHEGEYTREFDTEYKFFEYIYDKVLKGELKNQEIYILSQKSMCFSCDSVYNELVSKKEVIDANVKINVVSGKNNDSWIYRNYTNKSLNNRKNKVKNKKKGEKNDR